MEGAVAGSIRPRLQSTSAGPTSGRKKWLPGCNRVNKYSCFVSTFVGQPFISLQRSCCGLGSLAGKGQQKCYAASFSSLPRTA